MIDVFDQLCTRAGSVHTCPNQDWLLLHAKTAPENLAAGYPGLTPCLAYPSGSSYGLSVRMPTWWALSDHQKCGPRSVGCGHKRLVLRQLHPRYCCVVLTVPHAQMPRSDPPRTGQHRATSHLLQLDNLLIPGHQPPPLTARVLAPAVKLAPMGRDSQLDKRPRRHARSLSNGCATNNRSPQLRYEPQGPSITAAPRCTPPPITAASRRSGSCSIAAATCTRATPAGTTHRWAGPSSAVASARSTTDTPIGSQPSKPCSTPTPQSTESHCQPTIRNHPAQRSRTCCAPTASPTTRRTTCGGEAPAGRGGARGVAGSRSARRGQPARQKDRPAIRASDAGQARRFQTQPKDRITASINLHRWRCPR